jgi:hypothetical protein
MFCPGEQGRRIRDLDSRRHHADVGAVFGQIPHRELVAGPNQVLPFHAPLAERWRPGGTASDERPPSTAVHTDRAWRQ